MAEIDLLLSEDVQELSNSVQSNICDEEGGQKPISKLAIAKITVIMLLSIIGRYWRKTIIIIALYVLMFWLYGYWVLILLFICSMLVLLYQLSDQLVYWPNTPAESREIVRLPSAVGLPSENLFLYTKDNVKVHAAFIKQDIHTMNSVPTIIYLHGNAGNIGHRLSNAYDLYKYLGVNVLLVEYRGFGYSGGSPSENGLYLDAQAALSYISTRSDIDKSKIVLFGRSLGGAVAIDCASQPDIRNFIGALIVENTFTSIPDMAKNVFSGIPALTSLPLWCHKNKYTSKYKMCRLASPTLLLSGSKDTLVPPKMMMELYQACGAPLKTLYQFKNGTHNETWRCKGYYQTIGYFFEEVFLHKRILLKKLPTGIKFLREPQIL